MEVTLILGDFAETDPSSGKVHILGAGWSVTGPAPSPQAIVAFLRVSPDRVHSPIAFTARLLDKTRQVVETPGVGGMQRLEISGQVEIQVPDAWDAVSDLPASFAINIGALPLKPGSAYSWTVEIDGKEEAHADFIVRAS
ncbi:MAG TPA: hypothetical protein VMV17_15245 [Streptosporangiaceae bacterium]|nr:hypothetical protein [Streptosporangiaceae bacterium]